MGYNFIGGNRDQVYLMPPSLREWLPEKDLAWFVVDAVEQMNLGKFYRKYNSTGKGQAAYEPSLMVSLMLYAYCMGERSSRKIERLCERDIAFKIVATNTVPDHSTIARFRQEKGKELEELFTEALKLSAKAGLVKAGVVALDGTKVKADAALEANRTYAHIEREVKEMLEEAAEIDAKEDEVYGKDKRGDELPEELQDRNSRLARLRECKEQLEEEAAEGEARQREKIEAREAEEAQTGRKKRGRKPKEPVSEVVSEAKANVTDPGSKIMKTPSGYVQGYNGQAVVTEGQIIVAAELTTDENDIKQLHPMVEKARGNISDLEGKAGEIKTVLSDAGYCSESNLEKIGTEGPEHIIATKKDWKQKKAMRESQPPRGRIPGNLSLHERMERKVLTKRGGALYKKRGQMVEPVFGQIKSCRRIEKFMRRGFKACAQEWKLICATHNLLKLWRSEAVILN